MQQRSSFAAQSSQAANFNASLCRLAACFSVFLLLLLSFSSFSATNLAKISDVRIADRATDTRIVFDLTSPVKHSVFILQNPDRVVLDIEQCNENGKLKANHIGGTLVKELRYAQKTREKLRVVFDLNSSVSPKSFLLPPSNGKAYRLVIDLTSSTAVASTTAASEIAKPRVESVIAIQDAPTSYRDVVVAIDAGHGGKDPGATGRGRTREKDIVLAISKKLKKLIDQEPGMRAFLIRSSDTFVPLRVRIKKASK